MKEYYILDAGTYVPITEPFSSLNDLWESLENENCLFVPIGVMENDEVIEVFILEKNIDY